ncbi:hypothetical protein CABS01_07473 [Colletotrichum abscissum]|uniref:DUF6594 domain-containing protein n=1 Tax=Colletotrichum abscissum TaxID=1671311 RepID=A0A9Q0B664_9PEZI|nr:uncharacterized protein CABS01_07473 [Colletotrichum abscissum]KAI3558570.1 hypothetical protein CABS02_01185 [Colletotrichum abscissum]KAK1511515.1 hypothetical protein CABS01_07473 [Colletotrichum abscissum]
MSTAYHPPSVADVPVTTMDDCHTTDQGWLASDPVDELMRVVDAVPAPAPSSPFAQATSDKAVVPRDYPDHHMPADDTSTPVGLPRSRPRSATVRRHSSMPAPNPDSPTRRRIFGMEPTRSVSDQLITTADQESSSDETVIPAEKEQDQESPVRPASPTESTLTSFTALTERTHGSGSSSGSGSNITQASWPRRRGSEKSRAHDKSYLKTRRQSRSPKTQQQLSSSNVLSYLEPDSPNITPEAIQRSVEQSSYWRMPDPAAASYQSPSTRSTTSTASSSFQSDVFSEMGAGDQETDRSSSPDHSIYGDSPSMPGKFEVPMPPGHGHGQRQRDYRHYGTPEMPRGTANLPHLPPNALQPRLPGTHHGHPKHLPRAEKLPLTGYELIASKLCAGDDTERSSIKPIYRRFEALNHRLLLHLQDELAELEEQLHRLDTADTQTRRMQNCFLPASRRQDSLTAGELQWHKTDILGKVGYKLSQYNHVLSSFRETQHLPNPDPQDVDFYRAYLANHNPIVEIETRFLDPADDLVSLARPPSSSSSASSSSFSSDDLRTPQPRNAKLPSLSSLLTPESQSADRAERIRRLLISALTGYLPTLAIAFAAAFLLPILAFAVIPGFVGRMAVVLLVAVGVAAGVVQAGLFSRLGADRPARVAATEGVLASGVYVGVMAVVAGIFG